MIFKNQKNNLWLFLVLGLALAARLVPSWNSLFLVRADETIYWDMAHRLVYGDGCIACEYRVGARSMLYVWPMAAPLFIFKKLGLLSPDIYIPLVKSFLAILSLSIPIGMWRLAKYIYDDKVAWISLLFGCFWYELIITSSHGLPEYYSVYLCLTALSILDKNQNNLKSFFIGYLLGLALIFRPHNLVPISVICIFTLIQFDYKKRIIFLFAGFLALCMGLAVDYFTYGQFAHSFWLYGNSIFAVADMLGLNPKWQQIMNLTIVSGCIFPAVIGYGIINNKKNLFPITIILGGLLFFSIQGAQEFSYIAIIIPFLLCILAYILSTECDRLLRIALTGYVSFICLIGFLGEIPPLFIYRDNWKVNIRPNGAFYKDPILKTALELSKLSPGTVIWGFGDALATGGYYVFHHHNQLWFPAGVPAHAAELQTKNIHDFTRYLVIPIQSKCINGFHPIRKIGFIAIYENDIPVKYNDISNYYYEFQLPTDEPTMKIFLKKGLIDKEPPLTPWQIESRAVEKS